MSLTLEQLLGVFENYNLSLWPLPIFILVLGVAALFFTFIRKKYSDHILTGILSFLWLWTAVVFFLIYFGPVYDFAYLFGALFLIQGVLFLLAVLKPQFSFVFKNDAYSIVGILFIAYALLGYPVFGYFLGPTFPHLILLGFPCPIGVFTFGLFLMTEKSLPKRYLIIPFIWGISGFMPVSMGIFEDLGLIVAALLGTFLIVYRDKKKETQPKE